MKYAVLVRNPKSGKVILITEDDADSIQEGSAALYSTEEEAEKAALNDIPICRAWPYTIVEAP